MIQTSCKYCEFRKGTNCEIGKDLNVNKTIEDDYMIIDKFCLYRRPSGWKEAQNDRVENGETYEQIARSELSLDTTILVFIPPDATEKKIHKTIKMLNSLKYNKAPTVLFMNTSKIEPLFFFNCGLNLQWSCEQMLITETNEKNELRVLSENLCSKKVKSPFFITVDYDKKLPENYIVDIETLMIDKEESFICLKSRINSGNPFFYNTKLFRQVSGHMSGHAIAKLNGLARKQKCPTMIRKSPK